MTPGAPATSSTLDGVPFGGRGKALLGVGLVGEVLLKSLRSPEDLFFSNLLALLVPLGVPGVAGVGWAMGMISEPLSTRFGGLAVGEGLKSSMEPPGEALEADCDI